MVVFVECDETLTEELKPNRNEKITATTRPLILGALRVMDKIPHKTTNFTPKEII
jgi:hypothetical protein